MDDPLFDDAPYSGIYRTSEVWSDKVTGYLWRKANGATCIACGLPIKGRRYQVSNLKTELAEWYHVSCVTPDMWHEWLGDPRVALPA